MILCDALADSARSVLAKYMVIEPSRAMFRQYCMDLSYVVFMLEYWITTVQRKETVLKVELLGKLRS
jgi:hypothetical protein